MKYQLALCALLLALAAAPAPAIDVGSVSPGTITVPNLAGLPSGEGFVRLRIRGRVFAHGEPLPEGARIVRLRIKTSIVPMVLDSEPSDLGDLTLNRESTYARELYRAVLTKQVRVIADDQTLAQLLPATRASGRLRVEGEVRLVASPILVVDSVRRAR